MSPNNCKNCMYYNDKIKYDTSPCTNCARRFSDNFISKEEYKPGTISKRRKDAYRKLRKLGYSTYSKFNSYSTICKLSKIIGFQKIENNTYRLIIKNIYIYISPYISMADVDNIDNIYTYIGYFNCECNDNTEDKKELLELLKKIHKEKIKTICTNMTDNISKISYNEFILIKEIFEAMREERRYLKC